MNQIILCLVSLNYRFIKVLTFDRIAYLWLMVSLVFQLINWVIKAPNYIHPYDEIIRVPHGRRWSPLQLRLRLIQMEFIGKRLFGGNKGGLLLQNSNPMKIISWNVKGVGRKGFYSQVRLLISKYNLDIMETRVNSNRARNIIEKSICQILQKFLKTVIRVGFGFFGIIYRFSN